MDSMGLGITLNMLPSMMVAMKFDNLDKYRLACLKHNLTELYSMIFLDYQQVQVYKEHQMVRPSTNLPSALRPALLSHRLKHASIIVMSNLPIYFIQDTQVSSMAEILYQVGRYQQCNVKYSPIARYVDSCL